jgi:hypothetical protein
MTRGKLKAISRGNSTLQFFVLLAIASTAMTATVTKFNNLPPQQINLSSEDIYIFDIPSAVESTSQTYVKEIGINFTPTEEAKKYTFPNLRASSLKPEKLTTGLDLKSKLSKCESLEKISHSKLLFSYCS